MPNITPFITRAASTARQRPRCGSSSRQHAADDYGGRRRGLPVDVRACLLDAPELAHHHAEAATWPGDPALACLDTHSRVMAVLTLQTLGCDTTSVLRTDPDPLVRAAAALAPALAGSVHATRALLDALSAPAAGVSCAREYPHFGPIVMSCFLPAGGLRVDGNAPGAAAGRYAERQVVHDGEPLRDADAPRIGSPSP